MSRKYFFQVILLFSWSTSKDKTINSLFILCRSMNNKTLKKNTYKLKIYYYCCCCCYCCLKKNILFLLIYRIKTIFRFFFFYLISIYDKKPQINIYELIYILSFINRLLRIKPFGDLFFIFCQYMIIKPFTNIYELKIYIYFLKVILLSFLINF
jgi:hypothetical protein